MKVLTQGLPHFLREETSVRRVIIVPIQQCLENKALHHVGNRESKDKRIVTYQILAYV
jgi:hypothetical protein